jgi:hypothetical protein
MMIDREDDDDVEKKERRDTTTTNSCGLLCRSLLKTTLFITLDT